MSEKFAGARRERAVLADAQTRAITKAVREATRQDITNLRDSLRRTARELRALHRYAHPKCVDQGPDTCPTWHAIYAAERCAAMYALH